MDFQLRKKKAHQTRSYFNTLKSTSEKSIWANVRLTANTDVFIYFLVSNILKPPLLEQVLIKLDSKELEEIISALMSLNSLINTDLRVTKKQALLTPPPLFSTNLSTHESSTHDRRPRLQRRA